MGDRSNHVMNGLHEDEKNVKRTGGRTVVPINTKLKITTVCSSQVVTIVVSVDNLRQLDNGSDLLLCCEDSEIQSISWIAWMGVCMWGCGGLA